MGILGVVFGKDKDNVWISYKQNSTVRLIEIDKINERLAYENKE